MDKKRWFRRKRIIYSLIGAIVLIGLVFGSSVYAKNVMNTSELVHFFVPFPAGKVVRPMTVTNPAGGAVFTRPITINVDDRGILKRIFNPGIEGLSTHWLVNVDTKPHRIGLKLTEASFPIEWDVGAGIAFDPQTKIFAEALAPGEQMPDLGIDWFWHFSDEAMAKNVWYEGTLTVFDADTNETLTTIPIKFQKGGAVNEVPKGVR